MPRPKKVGGPEPKRRSRNGCWPCKARKVKCGEEKPRCLNCERQGEKCDYSIRLNWDGRTKKRPEDSTDGAGNVAVDFNLHRVISGGSTSALSSTPGSDISDSTFRSQGYGYQDAPNPGSMPPNYAPQLSGMRTEGNSLSYMNFAPAASQDTTSIDPTLIRHGTNSGAAAYYQNRETKELAEPAVNRNQDLFQGSSIPNVADQRLPFSYTARMGQVQLPRLHQSYPSPNSGIQSPNFSGQFDGSTSRSSHQMLPPVNAAFQSQQPPNYVSSNPHGEFSRAYSPEASVKRLRLSPADDSAPRVQGFQHPRSIPDSSRGQLPPSSLSHFHNSNGHAPLTPAASVTSDDATQTHGASTLTLLSQESPELRRVSVNSLLSDPTGDDDTPEPPTRNRGGQLAHALEESQTYGVDRGFPDLDIPKNDDANAISGMSPVAEALPMYTEGDQPLEFGFGLQPKGLAYGSGGYYANPVPVKIPRSLEPLPASLVENPMNLLYFHHFLNHTARILVIHDCSQNPFKTILPQMAVENENLLNLLLAYSASHRARLLNVSEPATRIARYMQDVFPSLRKALSYDNAANISNADLATAIMLASLEIISPNTFEVTVPWWKHLHMAREMIIARGGVASMRRKDKVSYFLSRWFAYLDVLGALSGGKNDRPLFNGSYWTNETSADEEDEFQIDCLLGFTTRFVTILAKIADLARRCEGERIDEEGNIRPEWQPSEDVVEAAEQLKADLQAARTHVFHPCNHVSAPSEDSDTAEIESGWDSVEMVATNDAFHWAGLVHLYRRVLGRCSKDPEVQHAVREIIGALYKVRKGGTAEACLLFPMFTAGCDAQDPGQRDKIMERVLSMEKSGMTQMHNARCLMQKVWETGKPWETFVTDSHFIG